MQSNLEPVLSGEKYEDLKQRYAERCAEVTGMRQALQAFHMKYVDMLVALGFDHIPPHQVVMEQLDALLEAVDEKAENEKGH